MTTKHAAPLLTPIATEQLAELIGGSDTGDLPPNDLIPPGCPVPWPEPRRPFDLFTL